MRLNDGKKVRDDSSSSKTHLSEWQDIAKECRAHQEHEKHPTSGPKDSTLYVGHVQQPSQQVESKDHEEDHAQ